MNTCGAVVALLIAIVEGDIITMVPGNITTVDVYATMHAFENDFSHTTMESIYD